MSAALRQRIYHRLEEAAKSGESLVSVVDGLVDIFREFGKHHELCDVNDLGPDLRPSTKPCNCGAK